MSIASSRAAPAARRRAPSYGSRQATPTAPSHFLPTAARRAPTTYGDGPSPTATPTASRSAPGNAWSRASTPASRTSTAARRAASTADDSAQGTSGVMAAGTVYGFAQSTARSRRRALPTPSRRVTLPALPPPRSAYCSKSGTGCCSALGSPVDELVGIVHGCARALCSARNTGGCIYAVRSNGDDDVDVHLQNLPAPRWRIKNF